MDLEFTFKLSQGTASLLVGEQKKSIPNDIMIEICQSILSTICTNRDYKNVTSMNKLLKIISMEMTPDESDEESEGAVTDTKGGSSEGEDDEGGASEKEDDESAKSKKPEPKKASVPQAKTASKPPVGKALPASQVKKSGKVQEMKEESEESEEE